MRDLAVRVSVEKDTLGRFLSFAQVMAQSRTIEEIQAQRAEIQYQIGVQQGQLAALQKSNELAEQLVLIEQKRLEIELLRQKREDADRAEHTAEIDRLKHLRNLLAEATLDLEDLRSDLDGRVSS